MAGDPTGDGAPAPSPPPGHGSTVHHTPAERDLSARVTADAGPAGAAGLVRADQRRRWRAGDRVPLEAYLAERPDLAADPSVLLDLVYGEYLLAEEVGAAPQPAAYAARFPAVAPKLADQLALHRALAGPTGGVFTTADAGDPSAAGAGPPPAPGYELLGELGRGGMGVVYKARQPRLNRVVALKTLPHPDRPGPADAIRFLAEAEAVAAVRHPHVVQVFEFGQHAGRPYFAMEFLPGGSLRDRLNEDGPVPPAAAAALVAKIARGVQAAHDQQIVHRDLKPGNVLFDADGEPKVTDFGLARRGAGSGLTRTQAVMGTPAYMAPEQARGDAKFVGPAADVYALGAVLYECLTGTVPFPGDDALAVLRRVAEDEPDPPRRRNRAVPRDLELVCLKCLRKEPVDRYPSAAALADDLERFLRGAPITARPVGTWERVWKWARRRPAAAGLGVASTVAVLALAAFVVTRSYQVRLGEANVRLQAAVEEADRLRGRVEEQQRRTQEALDRVERVRYSATIALAERELAANDLGRADELLEQCPEPLRGWEWSYLFGRAHVPRTVGRKHTGRVLALAYSPDGERLAAGASDGSVRVRDEGLWQVKAVVIPAHQGPVNAVAFSPDGVSLATAGEDRAVRVWELTNKKDVFRPGKDGPLFRAGPVLRHPGRVCALAYSPDGRRLAWAAWDGAVKVWEVGGKEPRELGRSDRPALAVAFDPTGRYLASAGMDQTVRVWGPAGEPEFTLGPHAGVVSGIAWRADGEQLAAGVDQVAQPGEVVVWEVRTRRSVRTLPGPPGGVPGVAYLPDGRLAATGRDGTIRLWSAAGEPGPILRGETPLLTPPAAHPDGKSLAAGGGSPAGTGAVTIWDLSGRPADRALPHQGTSSGLSFTPDGQRLASGGRDGVVRLWDVATGREVHAFRGHEGLVTGVAAGPDLLLVASAGYDGTVRVWDVPTGREAACLRGHDGPVWGVAFSPDGKRLASVGHDRTARVWDPETGRQVRAITGHDGHVLGVTFSPDGKRLATCGHDRTARVWDAETGHELLALRGHEATVAAVAFSPDGGTLATAGHDQSARLWDAATGREVRALRGHVAEIWGVAFSPDGSRVASAGADSAVKLWDPASGLEVFTLRADPRGVTGVTFGAGGRIAATTIGGPIRLWQASPRPRRSSAFDHDD